MRKKKNRKQWEKVDKFLLYRSLSDEDAQHFLMASESKRKEKRNSQLFFFRETAFLRHIDQGNESKIG